MCSAGGGIRSCKGISLEGLPLIFDRFKMLGDEHRVVILRKNHEMVVVRLKCASNQSGIGVNWVSRYGLRPTRLRAVVYVTITFRLRYGVITAVISCHTDISHLLTPTPVTLGSFQHISPLCLQLCTN